MNNCFQIGGQVSGEHFIGRKELLGYLKKCIVENPDRVAKAIIGLTRIGKSSLLSNILHDLPGNTLCIYEDLSEFSTYEQLWQDIGYALLDEIEEHNLEISAALRKNLGVICEENASWIKLSRSAKKLFRELFNDGLKVIMVLDEFDSASVMFRGTEHYELFRSLFSGGDYNITAITISRRNLHTIEGATYQSSTFHGVFDSMYIKGFNDGDMQEYYAILERYGVKLNEEQKENIEFYAGRIPFLLSILGHYILETYEKEKVVDIDKIFLTKCKAIDDYYRDCIKHLERDGDLKRLVPFVVGPNVGVTKMDRDELINLGYLFSKGGKFAGISEYFGKFLSTSYLELNIWNNITQVEKKMKYLLEKEFGAIIDHYQVGGASIKAIQKNILIKESTISDNSIANYRIFMNDTKKKFQIKSTYFDVMSLRDTFKIIVGCWYDIFSKYFDDDKLEKWKYKFDKCGFARNPVAHAHEEYLTELDKREVDTFCKQIFDVLAKTIGIETVCCLDENEILKKASNYTANVQKDSNVKKGDGFNTIGSKLRDLCVNGIKNDIVNERN